MEENVNTLSVLTYLHPEEELLYRCIKGLKQQKVSFVWIILGYKDPKIEGLKYTFWQLDSKILNKAQALNYALPKIKSSYIAYNDADDISLPGRFQSQLSFLENNKNIDILGGNLTVNGKVAGWPIYQKSEEIKAFLLLNNSMVNSSVMLRNAHIKWGLDVKYNPEYYRAEDYDFWWKAAKENLQFANLESELIDYHQSHNTKGDKELFFSRMVRERIIQYYCNKQLNPEELNTIHCFAERSFASKKVHEASKKWLLEVTPQYLHKTIRKHHFKDSFLRSRIKGLKIF